MKQTYRVVKNPSNNKWCVVGFEGKYWMQVSSDYNTKEDANKFMNRQYLSDKSMVAELGQNLLQV